MCVSSSIQTYLIDLFLYYTINVSSDDVSSTTRIAIFFWGYRRVRDISARSFISSSKTALMFCLSLYWISD